MCHLPRREESGASSVDVSSAPPNLVVSDAARRSQMSPVQRYEETRFIRSLGQGLGLQNSDDEFKMKEKNPFWKTHERTDITSNLKLFNLINPKYVWGF